MAWTTIPDGEYAEGQPVRGVTGLAMSDNVTAVANGDTGAPKIQQAALDTDSVGQAQIKTNFQSMSHFFSSRSFTVLTGGAYCMGFSLQGGGTGPEPDPTIRYGRQDASDTNYIFSAELSGVNSGSTYNGSRSYYINSSPPYNLGDGDIPLFVFLLIDNASSEIESIQTMTDPVWAYNGPTDIMPTRYSPISGGGHRIYKTLKDLSGIPTLLEAREAGGTALADRQRKIKEAPIIEMEIDQDYKNLDKNVVPHPWIQNDLTSKTVVMLDPVSSLCEDLLNIRNDTDTSDEEINIIRDYVDVGNTGLNRMGPRDVMIVSADWKLT